MYRIYRRDFLYSCLQQALRKRWSDKHIGWHGNEATRAVAIGDVARGDGSGCQWWRCSRGRLLSQIQLQSRRWSRLRTGQIRKCVSQTLDINGQIRKGINLHCIMNELHVYQSRKHELQSGELRVCDSTGNDETIDRWLSHRRTLRTFYTVNCTWSITVHYDAVRQESRSCGSFVSLKWL